MKRKKIRNINNLHLWDYGSIHHYIYTYNSYEMALHHFVAGTNIDKKDVPNEIIALSMSLINLNRLIHVKKITQELNKQIQAYLKKRKK
jgi:hypothetical protein